MQKKSAGMDPVQFKMAQQVTVDKDQVYYNRDVNFELSELNNRLARYISHVACLEKQNNKLALEITTLTENEFSKLKNFYESKLTEQSFQIKSCEKTIASLRLKIAEITEMLAKEKVSRSQLEEELIETKNKAETWVVSINTRNRELELELIDARNMEKTLKEKMERADHLHAMRIQQYQETRVRIEADSGYQNINALLNEKVEEWRKQYAVEIGTMRVELEETYKEKLNTLRMEIEEKHKMYSQLEENYTLMKSLFQKEIIAYKSLLEGEEHRLKLMSSSECATNRYHISYTKPDNIIEVIESDSEGRYVKLSNTSDQSIQLKGWKLYRVADDKEKVEFTFPKYSLEKGCYTTVFSASHGKKTFALKDQEWPQGRTVITTVVNEKGEVITTHNMLKENVTSSHADAEHRTGAFLLNISAPPVKGGHECEQRCLKQYRVDYKGPSVASNLAGVEITECNLDGEHVKLYNASSNDICLDSWILQQTVNEDDCMVIETQLQDVIKTGQSLKVKCKKLMDVQKVVTRLINQEKKVVAEHILQMSAVAGLQQDVNADKRESGCIMLDVSGMQGCAMQQRMKLQYMTETLFSKTLGNIAITDCDEKGKYVQLSNQSEEDEELEGCYITRVVERNAEEAVKYTFARGYVLKAGKSVKVWGSNQKKYLPDHLVLKHCDWPNGKNCITTLYSCDKNIIAQHSMATVSTELQ
ncbi:lamin-B2-like [Hydractinia symbiolongicarpus]|uniref:lamin-B2-like n=1 Tax=Hydractinia symbiolongicarpus TaxID=13093 RepID=UPI002550EB17|nr:lamin-B2-like [Hydractinia symbiolongicarpus]